MHQHEKYIARCIELAQKGNGWVAPNPLVGAVLVHDEKIIGEGWHQKYGEAHAEVNCIKSVVTNDSEKITASTLYVSLEPCNHFGKTPPCTDLIIKSGIKKVVIGCRDTNPQVNGSGIKKLKEAGIEVIENVLENDCKELNKIFFTFQKLHRPFIILKWAQTNDGFIAAENFKAIKISNSTIDFKMHALRSATAAIMVGFNTALYDNPKLTSRNNNNSKQPLRIVIDKKLALPAAHSLLADELSTLILNEKQNRIESNKEFLKIDFHQNWLNDLMQILHKKKITSLLVEGGTILLQSFIDNSLWDEAFVIANQEMNMEKGIKSPILSSIKFVEQIIEGTPIYSFTNLAR